MRVDADVEASRLRPLLRDLVALSAIPAVWIEREHARVGDTDADATPAVASGLADTLVGLLQLDFAFVRLFDPGGGGSVDVTRGDAWERFPEWVESHLAANGQFPRKEIAPEVGGGSEPCRGFAIPIGLEGEAGMVAAARERSDFPTATDQLLLSLAANQAATAFQSARLIRERRRAEEELREARDQLEVKVAERTAELRRSEAYSAQLAEEQAALRRVATLVAQGASPTAVFDAVAAEMEGLLDADGVTLSRNEPGAEVTVVAHRGPGASRVPPGSRVSHQGENVTSMVRRSERPARMDHYEGAHGAIAELVHTLGVRASVGAPIVVDGRLWGVIVANWRGEESPPADTEERMAQFAELLDTAIANGESREALAGLAQEQAALRRVATMVARGCSPEEVFVKVAEEAGRLLGVDSAAIQRYEPDGDCTVVGNWGKLGAAFRIGARLQLDGNSVIALVYRTGRPVRVDSYEHASGSAATRAREVGLRSGAGSPIVVNGRLWGALGVATSRAEPLPAGAEWRIAKFTELVATAISNVQALSDLTASRARVVAASDKTRRQIERDLHDGAQQRLVHIALNLKIAREAVRTEPEAVPALVDQALDHVEQATVELRELVHGILPPVLTQGGLRPAVRTLARRMPVPVQVDVTGCRLPAAVEATAYFVVAEALTNVVKHSGATHATVVARVEDRALQLQVSDDGVGGARPDGSGFVGVADRLAVFDGQLRVESPADGGTLVAAHIPLPG